MIARIWRGVTPTAKAAEYVEYIQKTGVTEYRETPGNRAVFILTRKQNDETEFLVLTLWDSLEAVRAFAGDPVDTAKYYPEDAQFLLHMDPRVTHHDVSVMVSD